MTDDIDDSVNAAFQMIEIATVRVTYFI